MPASLLQKQQAPPWVLRRVDGARVWLTFVTVGELATWVVVRRWGEDRRRPQNDTWIAACCLRYQIPLVTLKCIGPWVTGGIHHVGSTSVPGLPAKAVIDIMAGVESLDRSRPRNRESCVAELPVRAVPRR